MISVRSVLCDPASVPLFLAGAAPANNLPDGTTSIGRGPAWTSQLHLPHPSNARVWGRQVGKSRAAPKARARRVGAAASLHQLIPPPLFLALASICAGSGHQALEQNLRPESGSPFVFAHLKTLRRELAMRRAAAWP